MGRWIATAAVFAASVISVSGQMGGMGGMGGGKKKSFSPVKSDAKYIGCDVCQRMVSEAVAQAADLRAEAPKQKLEEEQVHDMLEKICKPKTKEGRWISKLDLVDSSSVDLKDKSLLGSTKGLAKGKDYILVKEHESPGHCEQECETVAKSCVDMMDEELDVDDFAVKVWSGKTDVKDLQAWACSESAERCGGKRTPLKKARQDYIFREKSDQEVQMDELMANMEAAGMGGMSMYSRDDMEDMMQDPYGGYGGYGGDEF